MRKIGHKNDLKLREEQFEVLSEIIFRAESKNESNAALKTLLTQSEQETIAQRVAILNMFLKGKKYWEIEIYTGSSPTTISRSLDLYYKNGENNHDFKKILSKIKIKKLETRSAKSSHTGMGIGTRSLINENARQKAVWQKTRQEKEIEESKKRVSRKLNQNRNKQQNF